MSNKQLSIPFKLVQIEEKQFATFENVLEKESSIEQEVGFGFGVDIENYVIGVTMEYTIMKENAPMIKQTVVCYFKVETSEFEKYLKKEDAIVLPCGFGKHLAMITVGTTRGVLFANTKNTPFNQYILGLINVDIMFEEDIVIKF